MSIPRLFLMLFAGALTYFIAVLIVGNLSAAIQMPVEVFGMFGLGTGALGVWVTFTYSIPVALVVFAGAFITLQKNLSQWRLALLSFGLGMLLIWVVGSYPLTAPPIWAISAAFAPWLGLLFALQYYSSAERKAVLVHAS